MATLSGVEKILNGTVKAVAADGTERILRNGDQVQAGEKVLADGKVITVDAGAVFKDVPDAALIELDHAMDIALADIPQDGNVLGQERSADRAPSVEEIQQAILAGKDVSEFEATAAGDSVGDSIHDEVVINYLGGEGKPGYGFDTSGTENHFSNPADQILPIVEEIAEGPVGGNGAPGNGPEGSGGSQGNNGSDHIPPVDASGEDQNPPQETGGDETPPEETPPEETPPEETPPEETPPEETPPEETPPEETPPEETPPEETPPEETPPDETPPDQTPPDETPPVDTSGGEENPPQETGGGENPPDNGSGNPDVVTNSAPVVEDTTIWVPSDPAQLASGYESAPAGYSPLLVSLPTDVDGDNLVVTATSSPAGVFYWDGSALHAVTDGTVLFDTANGVNWLNSLYYQPTAGVDDAPAVALNLSVADGVNDPVLQTVTINEVSGNQLPSESSIIGNGSDPLTSGKDQTTTLTLSQSFVDGISGNVNLATIVVSTDFQKAPFDVPIPAAEQSPGAFNDNNSAGTHRETEVQVELHVNGNKFVIIEADQTAGEFEQSWFFNADTGLMEATVDYNHIYQLDTAGNPTLTTLADYLTANAPQAGDVWTLVYQDSGQGSYQARSVNFEFYSRDPGDPGIVVNGTDGADQAFGTSGSDELTGNGGNDVLIGRGGNDLLDGGDGSDIFVFKADSLDGTSADTINNFAVGDGGDILNIHDVLSGLVDPATVDNTTIGDYLKVTSNGTDTTVAVDTNGAAAGGEVVLANLVGVDTTLDTLLANNQVDWTNDVS